MRVQHDGSWPVTALQQRRIRRKVCIRAISPGVNDLTAVRWKARQESVMAKKAAASGIRIVPLGDRVVLKRAEAEEKTAGGILLPDAAKGKPQRGEVVSVGDGHVNDKGERVPLSVKEGDRVVFSSYAGDEITVGDETFLLMRESDILATL